MDKQGPGQPAAPPQLEIIRGEDKGKTFTISSITSLGRERDNDVILIDPKISRYHAQIAPDKERWVLTDLGSSNHTYLNDEIISEPKVLQANDRIRLGEIELAFKETVGHQVDTLAYKAKEGQAPPVAAPAPIAAPSSKSAAPPRLALIAGVFVVLLCLAAVVVLFMIGRLSGDSDETTAVVDGPTTDSTELSPDELPDTTPSGPPVSLNLVYEDDFSDSFGGWDDAFDAYTTKQYGNNRYQIEISTSNLVAWGMANRDVSDFELEVEARQEAGGEPNSFGLLFRFQDRNNFYRFDISGDGFFLVSKFFEGEWTNLVDWTASPHISQETNLIRVSAFGSEITVSVNGQELARVSDDSLTHGNFGFFASTFDDEYMWVSYDNLKLWIPEGQEIALIPTPTRPSVPLSSAPESEVTAEAESLPASDGEEEASLQEVAQTEGPTLESGTEEAESEVALAETATPEPTRRLRATATPVPLPAYASRDQLLRRGEAQVTGRIIYPLFDPERSTFDIFMADAADGSNRELVQAEASQPTFNETGTEIAYRSWQSDKRGLFARALGSDEAWGFDLFFESARPQFSKAGTIMYFSRTGGEEPALYHVIDGEGLVMRRDGGPIQGRSPKWGPDGQQFIYSSCIGGTCGLLLGNQNGSLVQLTDNPSDTNPEISPDGSTVVFMSDRSGDWEIYRVDIDGQNLTALTSDDANDGLPTWSPDGEKIAFVASRDGKWAMWNMDPDGRNQRRLFLLGGSVDGQVEHDPANSRGWLEENIDWAP